GRQRRPRRLDRRGARGQSQGSGALQGRGNQAARLPAGPSDEEERRQGRPQEGGPHAAGEAQVGTGSALMDAASPGAALGRRRYFVESGISPIKPSTLIGSTVTLPYRITQCRCGPVTRPVEPTLPIRCPRFTTSPTFTSVRLRWK